MANAESDPLNSLARLEVQFCVDVLTMNLSPVCLPREALGPLYKAVNSAIQMEIAQPESVREVRAALLDVAAAISVLPWEQWAVASAFDVVCPVYDQ